MEHLCCEIRLAEDPEKRGPGVIHGVLMPYGEIASDRPEMFAEASLVWPDEGIVLREMHNRQAPIVRFVPLSAPGEARVVIPLPPTQRGRDAATGVKNGTYRGLSVEFRAHQEGRQGMVRVIHRGMLHGAGLVDDASYKGASIEVRERRQRRPRIWL